MKNRNKAFTLAEALILLLIVSILAAALIPVITKKHKDVAAHGKWICTLDQNGRHVIKTIIDGKDSGFVTSNSSSCTFTPPANAKDFKILAVGGGGGGAGGKSGSEDIVFDSRAGEDSYAGNVTKEGTFTIAGVGGGGGGGGMACGEAKNHIAIHTFENHNCSPTTDYNWNTSTQSYGAKFPGCNNGSGVWNPEHDANHTYGYVDMAWPEWENKKNYEKLYQNIEEYTDQYKTNKTYYDPEFKKDYINNYTYENFKKLIGCFAEKSPYTPNLSETSSKNANGKYGLYLQGKGNYSSIKCWNLPGEGGHSGGSISASNKSIKAGSSIYVSVGRAGEARKSLTSTESVGMYMPNNSKKTKNVYVGADGEDGTDTIVNIGGQTFTGAGGSGGYSRQIVNITYKNIPVYECPVVEYTKTNWTNRYDCGGRNETSCGNTNGCQKNYKRDWQSCGGGGKCSEKTSYSTCYGYYEDVEQEDGTTKRQYHSCYDQYGPSYFSYCSSGTHSGPAYTVDTSKCVKKIRKQYFSIPACINTKDQKPALESGNPNYTRADYPHLVSPIKTLAIEHLSNLGTTMDFGDYGSGGYGAGEESKTYIIPTSDGNYDIKLHGEAGMEGYVYIARVSYTGGGGGQAGGYLSTMLKKIGKIKVVVGSVGVPSSQNSGVAGSNGGDTIIYNADGSVLFTLKGGLGGKSDSTEAVYSAGLVKGVNGAPSPMENPNNKAKITPYGGYNGNNSSIHGHTPLTEASKISGYGSFTGGGPLDVTYGAGGGGGGATKTQAGNGGIGAPGAVIIEW